jgi:hypothetical protein
MKVCPICQATYDDGVDFCFKEGAPLEQQVSGEAEDTAVEHDRSGLTIEDLEPPDAVSLSGLIPVATEEDDLATLTMAAEPPAMLEEDELATVTSGVEQLASGTELSSVASVDPFEKPEDVDFRNRMEAASVDRELEPPGVGDTHDKMETVHWEGPPRTAEYAESGAGGFLKLIVGIVIALALAFSLIPGEQTETDNAPVSTPVAQTSSEQPTPAATEPAEDPSTIGDDGSSGDIEEPSMEEGDPDRVGEDGSPLVEGAEEPEEGDQEASEDEADAEDAAVDSEGPVDGEEAQDSASVEEDPGLSAAERREQARKEARKEAREERRKKREEERRKRLKEERKQRREAARAEAKKKEAEADAAPVDPGNPWTSPSPGSSAPVAPSAAASDASNPWGVNQPDVKGGTKATSAMVTVNTKPRAARVKLAGKNRGSSPVRVELPIGTHEVQVTKDGFVSKSTYVKVVDGSPVALSVALEPLESTQEETLGTLFISSSPAGALLYVDGASKGRTPISVPIAEGKYTLKLVADGKAPLEKRIKVDFTRGKTVRRFIEIP